MEKVRIGVVGAGMMTQLVHIPGLIDLPRCEVVALAEVRRRLGERIAQKHRIPRVYESHKELAEDPEVDAVVVVTRDDFHAPVAIDLLTAGKHVLVEKPLATWVAEGAEMVAAAQRTNTVLMVNYMKRYDPGVELAKRIIHELRESHELGEITFVRSHRFGDDLFCNLGEPVTTDEPYPHRETIPPAWLPRELTGTFRDFNNVYCHTIDLLRYLLGEVTEVPFATVGGHNRGNIIVLEFEGFIAALDGSHSGAYWEEVIKIHFSDGWLEIKTPPSLLRNVPAEVSICKALTQPEIVKPRADWEWSFRRAHEHFLDCVIHKRDPKSSGSDALQDLDVIETAFRRHLSLPGG